MRRILSRRNEVAVFEKPGPEDRHPLVLVHGGPGAGHQQLAPLFELADERRVVAYDQLDCGRSSRTNDPRLWTIEGYAEELADVIDATCPGGFHLLGHSWGAAVAIEAIAEKRVARPVSIVLSSPLVATDVWVSDSRPLFTRILAGSRARHHDPSVAVQHALEIFNAEHWCRDPKVRAKLLEEREGFSATVYRNMWGETEFAPTGSLRSLDLTGKLAGLATAVLVTRGEHDMVGRETARRWASSSGGSLEEFPGAAHLPFLEAREAFGARLRTFLRSHDAAP